MALSHGLAQAGHAPTQLDTEATVTFGQSDGGFAITDIALTCPWPGRRDRRGGVQGGGRGREGRLSVSKAFKGNVPMSVEATLA